MKSFRLWIIPLACLSILALTGLACQITAPAASTPTVVATEAPVSTDGVDPAPYPPANSDPNLVPSEPYPGSDPAQAAPLVPTTAAVLYPGVQDGAEVNWEQAVAMILNNEVTQVMQTHDLKVYLTLKDGRTLSSTEPAIDDVMRIIDFCGEPCKDILVATE